MNAPSRAGAAVLLVAVVAGIAFWWPDRGAPAYDTVPVARADIEATVTAIGTLQPRKYVDVGAQVSGQVNRLHVQAGDTVKKGQLLVEIDPSVQQATVDAGRASLAGLRAQLADQQAQHRLAGQQLARQRQMAQDEATRLEDLQAAEAAFASAGAKSDNLRAQIDQTQATLKADEARLGYTRIYASMAGTVVSVEAREGQTLNATYQTPNILRIADLGAMTVWTEVSEADVRRVKPAMPVYFTTLGGHGDGRGDEVPRRWQGVVRQVLPAPPVAENKGATTATPATATKAVAYTVLFDVDNADGELMPQMTAQVAFVTASASNAIAVPLAAITSVTAAGGATGARGSHTARVLASNGRPELRTLRVGARSRHHAEVLEGLKEGERLVLGEAKPVTGLGWLQW
ncbi:efflux RND transporter periplasmic adaptor subunit [Variovorax sp. RCC_210]|uniref:efflux RND transporter periplasmic adaptor subunit n=1 Tax=Variovorax sp. RCC_210 TaxID=3239217 RepID=UPI0035231A7C